MLNDSYESKFSFDYYNNNEGSQSIIENFTKPIFKIFAVNESTNIDKICSICGSSFNNKFNMERHVREIHEKNDKIGVVKNKYEISNIIQINEELSSKSNINIDHPNKYKISTIIEQTEEKKFFVEDKQNSFEIITKNRNELNKESQNNKKNNNDFTKDEKNELNNSFWLFQLNKYNFYEIFQKYEHIPLKNYFLFKNLIIGHGKYGTVWFAIDVNKSNLVAIKSNNIIKSKNLINFEIDIMKKLEKYEIFSKFYDKIEVIDRIFIVETLHGPTIEKLRNFCGRKFSVKTIYKIGAEILLCLKLFHEAGFIYLDLKSDNISLLLNPITVNGSEINITLIDYGFAEKYMDDKGIHYSKNKSAKLYGNAYLSSINALCKNPVSRKDDIINLCYLLIDLYLGSLPWVNLGTDENGIKKTIELKKIYTPEILCGKGLKEVISIYNSANNLKFAQSPDYEKYINLLNPIKKNCKKDKAQKFLFDWEAKFKKIIKNDNDLDNVAKNNKLIQKLFDGYPESFIKNYLGKYQN